MQYGFTDFKVSDLGFEDIQKLNPGDIRYKVDLNDARQSTAKNHKAGDRYYDHHNVNDGPDAKLLELDKNNKPYNYKVLD
jgi:nitrite reductase (cytochrome c-552)